MHLDQLFNYYGSDKTRNGYAGVYHSLLKNINTKPLNVLEVGIGTLIPGVPSSMLGWCLDGYKPGGSLRAWRDYLTNSHIYGIDPQPDCQFSEERITTFQTYSTDSQKVNELLRDLKFDFIVDDGSHFDEHQVDTLKILFKRVNSGGFYVIEDITPRSRVLTEFFPDILSTIGDDLWFVTERRNQLIVSKK